MHCRFRGAFHHDDRGRIERAARAAETNRTRRDIRRPTWAFLYFATPHDGSPYWGVRLTDGRMISADTADGLVTRLEALHADSQRT